MPESVPKDLDGDDDSDLTVVENVVVGDALKVRRTRCIIGSAGKRHGPRPILKDPSNISIPTISNTFEVAIRM